MTVDEARSDLERFIPLRLRESFNQPGSVGTVLLSLLALVHAEAQTRVKETMQAHNEFQHHSSEDSQF